MRNVDENLHSHLWKETLNASCCGSCFQALQKMNSGDTPLNTAALLIEKQKNAQSPFVILSGGGQTFSTGCVTVYL